MRAICAIEKCGEFVKGRGYCRDHYYRLYGHGDPLAPLKYVRPPKDATPGERFWRKVDQSGTCWVWLGAKTRDDYGKFSVSRKYVAAHRFAYELVIGPIAPGLEIDHVCFNTLCVNPEHLEPVTPQENKRRRAARITHCIHGHEFTPENTYVRPGIGSRSCRTCQRATVARYAARRSAA